MDIDEVCVLPARICPSLSVLGSYGNANVHSLIDIYFRPFGRSFFSDHTIRDIFSYEFDSESRP